MEIKTTSQKHCVEVTPSFSFPVVFTHDVFDIENSSLADVFPEDAPQMLLFIDAGLLEAWPDLEQRAGAYLRHHGLATGGEARILPGGEVVKDGWKYVYQTMDTIRANRLCRHSVVIALGGGAFLDAVGLASALVHRGLRLIRLPSTALSQGDSGVGVKNGINLEGEKNIAGVFTPPHAVVNDFDFLKTLSKDLILDGVAEAIKVALIKDTAFFEKLEVASAKPFTLADDIVEKSALLHMEHIASSGDPYESGQSRPLDFGHWAAHWLENVSAYDTRHGQAVSIGMALDAVVACELGLLESTDRDRVLEMLSNFGMQRWHDFLEREEGESLALMEGLRQFGEHLGGVPTIPLPEGIGNRRDVRDLDEALIRRCVGILKELVCS